jgi:zinc protease
MKAMTRRFVAAATIFGAVANSYAQTPPASVPDATQGPRLEVPYTQFVLPNGLRVVLHEDHTVPLLTVNTWYHVGSAREKPGRTGFAHLFEHLMFMGSGHVKYGLFDSLLEAAGGTNNASTGADATNYYIDVPSNALDLALYLESDRMGFLLDAMSPKTVDAQRDVVKNERRQRLENAPYGMASIEIAKLLYPEGHPYQWPTIGYMEDLTAASYEDVLDFFKKYYQPSNATMVIAGDFESAAGKAAAEKWLSDVKPGSGIVPPIDFPHPYLTEIKKKTIQDRVQLPRLYLDWITPAHFTPGDAELDVLSLVLAGGKNSRLYKRLVYELQIAQDVSALQASQALNSQYEITVTARPPAAGATASSSIEKIRGIVDEELRKLQEAPPTEREFQRAINQIEASFYDRMERVGEFGGIGDQLNAYDFAAGNPGYFNEDLARYRALAPPDIQAAALRFLPLDRRVELIVEPAK